MEYKGQDFYCDVAILGLVDLKKVIETKNVLAFHHTKPHWPVHIVVIPKVHIPSFTLVGEEHYAIFLELLMTVQQVARRVEEEQGAARVLTNLGSYQDSKHLHFHVNSGDPLK